MRKIKHLKYLLLLLTLLLAMTVLISCDQTLLDVYTEVESDFSGTRTVEIAVKTDYLKRGEVVLDQNKSLFDKILESLPKGEIETFEQEGYTHFRSIVEFEDINFLQHVSIDGFSEIPPERFYAKMSSDDYFFHRDYYFSDHIDMQVDEILLGSENEDLVRMDDLFKADTSIFNITYQVRFPVKILDTDADKIGDNNIAIWDIEYGTKRNIYINGKKTKFLPYILLIVLGLIVLFAMFIVFALAFSSRRRRRDKKPEKSFYAYDNYFKKDKYFSRPDDEDDD